jgi:hypothetical protein
MKLNLSKSYDRGRATTYLEKLIKKGAKIELKEFRAKRSLDQNAYLHVCFAMIADETGYTIEEAKVLFKRAFGSFMVYEKDNNKFLRSTADMDKHEMTIFIDWLRQTAMDQLGLYILTPREYYENQFEIEQQIQYVK